MVALLSAPARRDSHRLGPGTRSLIIKRSVAVADHKTSISLEDAFWAALKEIANLKQMTLADLVTAVDAERRQGNLSSSVRLFILDFYRSQLKQGELPNKRRQFGS